MLFASQLKRTGRVRLHAVLSCAFTLACVHASAMTLKHSTLLAEGLRSSSPAAHRIRSHNPIRLCKVLRDQRSGPLRAVPQLAAQPFISWRALGSRDLSASDPTAFVILRIKWRPNCRYQGFSLLRLTWLWCDVVVVYPEVPEQLGVR